MKKAFIHTFLASPMTGDEIERRSFETIDAKMDGHDFGPDQWEIVRRMIHTAGDFSLSRDVRFTPDAVQCGMDALRAGVPITVDSNMIRAGISLERLRRVNAGYCPEKIFCHVADDDVALRASAARLPRSLFAIRKAKAVLDGGIAVFGNAPVALLEMNRMVQEDGIRPALVIAMPVGFIHVTESKEELMALGLPSIGIAGSRGGSTLALSVVHALCQLAITSRDTP